MSMGLARDAGGGFQHEPILVDRLADGVDLPRLGLRAGRGATKSSSAAANQTRLCDAAPPPVT